jgi:hypothetical protein
LDSNTIQETETELELEEASVPVNQPESDNIVLDIEELNLVPESNEESLTELDLTNTLENNLETMTLKKPNQVYYEIYKKARDKAKQLKKEAILAYLESKNIKKTYMLEDIDESDSDGEFDGIDSDLEEDLE